MSHAMDLQPIVAIVGVRPDLMPDNPESATVKSLNSDSADRLQA
jgi:hypothetical protein